MERNVGIEKKSCLARVLDLALKQECELSRELASGERIGMSESERMAFRSALAEIAEMIQAVRDRSSGMRLVVSRPLREKS